MLCGNMAINTEFFPFGHCPPYLVSLLPAASLGVHVYSIFGPVSFGVELLRNLKCKDSTEMVQSPTYHFVLMLKER